MSAATTHSLPFDPATVEFDPLLRRLNLANNRRNWRQLLDRAETHGWSCREFLGVLVTEEIAHRQQTRTQRSVRQTRFPFLKTVEEFDFSFQSSVRLPSLGNYLRPELVSRHRLPRHPEWLHRSLRHRRRADRELVGGQSGTADCTSNSPTTCSRTFW